MKPGRYTDIDIDTYHAGPGVSRSTLMRLEEGSPLECRHYMEHGIDATPAMQLGSLVDAMVYEPEDVEARYIVKPSFGRSKAALVEKEAWEEEHGHKGILTPAAWEQAECIAGAVRNSKAVRALMGDARAQESWYFEEQTSSGPLLVKTRPDGYDADQAVTFDLKTTYSLSERKLATSIVDGGYDVQAALNMVAARALGLPWKGHVLVWAGKSAPFDVRLQLIEPNSVWLDYGLSRAIRLMDTFARCQATNQWAGYSDTIETIAAPKWLAKKLEAEEFLDRAQQREGEAA